ncbi:MAG: hypothetical protein P8J79_00025 [Halioglobus sp.]|nr:hypothetical protein [Halioglobus sp.]
MSKTFSMMPRFFSQPGLNAVLLSLLLLVLALLAGIYVGWVTAYKEMGASPRHGGDGTQLELLALRQKLAAVLDDIQVQRTRHEVDSRALELVRSEMVDQKELTANLEEGLRFFRSLMVSEGDAAGLRLRDPELVAVGTPRRIEYRIFVQQQSRANKLVEGSMSLQVFGFDGQREVRYALPELSAGIDDALKPLHFRYFQAVEGVLTLPEGFEPKGLAVIVEATEPRDIIIREEFPWKLQQQFINLGE